MQYIQLKRALEDFTVFSLKDIRKVDGRFHRRRLNDWQDKGYIKKVIKGYYLFSDLVLNENILFDIANRIYRPSYISLEAALSYYHLIPENVYRLTSVSSRRTYAFKTDIGEFSYRAAAPRLFWGYVIVKYNDRSFKIAAAEKAVLDHFYFNNHLRCISDFAGLRLNREMFFKQVDENRLFEMLNKFRQKRLAKRVEAFWGFMKNA